jgi:two-component system, chemotaxis family, chemotaxis protein CheY
MNDPVLIVDDSATIRMQVKRILTENQLTVVEAFDGADAWEKLSAGGRYSLVISDINMPRMNGIELLERMRSTGNATPILMLTAEGAAELIAKARQLGASGWLLKPVNAQHLQSALNKFVAQQPGAR